MFAETLLAGILFQDYGQNRKLNFTKDLIAGLSEPSQSVKYGGAMEC